MESCSYHYDLTKDQIIRLKIGGKKHEKLEAIVRTFLFLILLPHNFLTTKYWCLLNILCEKDVVDPTDLTYPKSVPINPNALIPLLNVEKA